MTSNNNLLAGLSKVASLLSKTMKDKLTPGSYPREIKDSIIEGAPQLTQDGAYVEVSLGAKTAKAFEWGSGLRAERGAKTRYPIAPRNASVLAFPWDIGATLNPSETGGIGGVTVPTPGSAPGAYPGVPSGKKVFLPIVMHPGIAARPYIRPSIQEINPEVRRILGQAFKVDLLIGTERVITIEVG